MDSPFKDSTIKTKWLGMISSYTFNKIRMQIYYNLSYVIVQKHNTFFILIWQFLSFLLIKYMLNNKIV